MERKPDEAAEAKPKVLIIDGDRIRLQLTAELLRGRYDVRTASSEEEAFRPQPGWVPRLIIADAAMPEIPALGFLYRIGAVAELARVPVLMTTDDPAPGEQSLLKQSPNFRGSIPRNASQRQLQEAVSQALGPGPRLGPPPGSDAGAPAPIRYKALITDDERSFIQFVDMALHRGDVEFHRASDGREALDLARSLKPDVIVSDVMMPGLTGVELMRELAKDPRLKDIPCILVTSTRMNPKQVELLLRDLPSVRYVLPKPCSIGALQSAFKALLKPKGPVST